MFTLDNFWQILNFLDGTSSLVLDSNTQILAPSERAVTNKLFENTIDQIVFNSDDYARLKNFLVNWYASHRTIITTQRRANDVFSLPEDQLDELLHSFGFNFSTTPLSFLTKANFFLDLVNLYKVKGTPQTLIDILQYYGLSDIDLAEYWLEKNDTGNLIFRSERYLPSGVLDINFSDIDYDVMTRFDPHWRLTEAQALNLVNQNKIALPSKSPYFSIRPRYDLTLLKMLMSVVQRHVQDDYDTYSSGGELSRDIKLTEININASFLELYLSCDYVFNELYDHTDSSDERFYCYDGTSIPNITAIANQWENRTKRLTSSLIENVSRELWNEKIAAFNDLFTRQMISNFFDTHDTGDLLQALNSSLYDVLNIYISAGNGEQLLSYLLKDLNDWIIENIGPGYPNIATTILGVGSLIEINKVIKFFKPYHARLVNLEFALVEQNPLTDSIVMEDSTGPLGITEIAVDFDVADGSPCCDGDSTAGCVVDCVDSTSLYDARRTYDCGSYFDIGASMDQETLDLLLRETIDDTLNAHDATSLNAYDQMLFVDATAFDSTAAICDGSGVLSIVLAGGWANVDEGGYFDSEHGNDLVQIYMEDFGCYSPTPPPPPPPPPPGTAWTITSSLNQVKRGLFGCGTALGALCFGGFTNPAAYPISSTEIWNGSSWATTSNLNMGHNDHAGCGTTLDALSFGGLTGWGAEVEITEIWNGSSWATTSNLNQKRTNLSGCGTTLSALSFGGYMGGILKTTETWNGSSWATTSVLNTAVYYNSGCGNTLNALSFGGMSSSYSNKTEIWNGSSWATTSNLNQARYALSGSGSTSDALSFGGDTGSRVGKTEIWNGSVWTTTSNLNQIKYKAAGCGDVVDALSFGGDSGSNLDVTEIWS